jgi:hypothetical protein
MQLKFVSSCRTPHGPCLRKGSALGFWVSQVHGIAKVGLIQVRFKKAGGLLPWVMLRMSTISGLLGANAIARGVRQAFAAARGANPSAAGRASAGGTRDTLEISPEAKALLAKDTAPSTGQTAASRGAPSWRIEDVRASYEMGLRELEQKLVALFKERGIEVDERVQLEAMADGRIAVIGEHPQKEAIERLLADDAELRGLFTRLDSQAAILRDHGRAKSNWPQLRVTMSSTGLQSNLRLEPAASA